MNINGMINGLGHTSVLYFISISEPLCFTSTCLDRTLKRRRDSMPGCTRCSNPKEILCGNFYYIHQVFGSHEKNTICDFLPAAVLPESLTSDGEQSVASCHSLGNYNTCAKLNFSITVVLLASSSDSKVLFCVKKDLMWSETKKRLL